MISYCKRCNEPIWRTYLWNGLKAVAEYWPRDWQPGVKEQLTHCPGCGEWLTESGLANHPTSEAYQ